jgi:WD40 repeat protein
MCFLVLVFVLSMRASAQDAPASPWQDVVPVARFGYGGLLSVYWSPVTGQLAAVSERGLQFYDSDLTLQAKRRFEESTPNNGTIFSPDMHFVALVEERGLIVRDTTSWEPILALDSFSAPSWSPDSSLLATWSNSILQVWDVKAATMRIEFPELVSDGAAVQWSPDGAVIAVPAGETIVMVNVRTGDIVRVHDFAQIADFEWSRDGRWFVIAGLPDPLPLDHNPNHLVPYSLVRLDAVTGEIVTTYPLPQSEDAVYSASYYVTISPNGRYVSAYLSWAKSIEAYRWDNFGMAVYDLETGQPVSRPGASRLTFDVPYTSWSPDGSRFATSTGSSLQIFEIASGQQVADLPAYINVTNQTVWTDDGTGLVAAGGLWDVTGEFPQYAHVMDAPTPPQDRYVAPHKPTCTLQDRYDCPEFMVPDPLVFDYDRPPYDWNLLQWIPDRTLAISYEIDIEYPGTPEYEDEIPPEERYIIWDTLTGEKMDERVYLGLQTAWVYDIEGADYIESESRAFNIRHNTRFMAVGDDEIVDLREGTSVPLQNINRWEWREAWFGPEGNYVYSYDTNGCFKVFEPFTGEFLYETVPASRYGLWFTADLTLTFVQDDLGTLTIYKTSSGEMLLQTYTANTNPLLLWNDDRSQLAIGGENRAVILFDMTTQKRLGILRGHKGAITSMAWNPVCDYAAMEVCRYVLASSDSTGEVILWGMERRDTLVETVPEAPTGPVYDLPIAEVDFDELTPLWSFVTFSDAYGYPQAQTIRWAEGNIRINGDTYYTDELIDLEEPPEGVSWIQPSDITGDGRMVTGWGAIYDAEGHYLTEVTSGQVADAIFDPVGERVITAERLDTENVLSGWVREYSAESGQFITAWGGGNPDFDHIAYSPDGLWIATATDPYYRMGARVQVWFADRFNTQYSSLIGHTDRITALYWDGGDMITSSLDGTVRRWNIHTGWPLARWDHPTHAGITQMSWRDDHSLLLSAGDNLYILEADSLAVRRIVQGVGGGPFDWSPDKKQVTVIGSD